MPAGDDTTELARRLAEVDALRRRVLNVIPHALRTPITTLRGMAEALATATEEEIREQIAPALGRLAVQAEHLLDDMLIAAGYTTALPTGAPAPSLVLPTVRRVWDELGSQAILEVEGSEELAALAPPGSLFKMLVHLLDNAVKYGEGTVRASVRLVDEGQCVELDIETEGVEPADLRMLMEPFYRGEAAVMRASGLGVGLTVAASLAQQANGSLTVEAAPAGGVRCRVHLPAAPAATR